MIYIAISLSLYITVLLALVAVIGDVLVSHSKIKIFQAVFDNATHCMIGGLSWFLVCIYCKKINYGVIIEIIICAAISSLIDLDHFAMAKSFSLQDATNLEGRPLLHCSTFPIFICIFLLLISPVMHNNLMLIFGLILLTAFISHHTRDAIRRGYWLYPFGSTPTLPYTAYIIISCTLPYFIFLLYRYLRILPLSHLDSLMITSNQV